MIRWRQHLIGALIALALWTTATMSVNGAAPTTPAPDYADAEGTSAKPWPSVQNGDVLEAHTYQIDGGTLIMARYVVNLDYTTKDSTNRIAASDATSASARTQIIIYEIDGGSKETICSNPQNTNLCILRGVREASDFVADGYSHNFAALYFANEVFETVSIDMLGIANASSPVSLAYVTSTLQSGESSAIKASITRYARNMLKSIQSGSAWTDASVALVNSANTLTEDGEAYMQDNAPYLRILAPTLYEGSLGYPPFRFKYSDGTEAQQAIDAAFGSTDDDPDRTQLFRNSFKGLESWTGVPERTISTIVVICVGVGVAWFGMRIAQSALVVIPIFIIVMSGGVLMSWVPMALIAAIGTIAAIIITFLFFMKRA